MASEDDFLAMVVAARRNHPNARILLRTHPDTRFSKKRGVLASLVNREPILAEVEVVSDSIHPHSCSILLMRYIPFLLSLGLKHCSWVKRYTVLACHSMLVGG